MPYDCIVYLQIPGDASKAIVKMNEFLCGLAAAHVIVEDIEMTPSDRRDVP